ncbi:glycosyl hydrolase family 18 protein [Cohnella terricola]|uniref:chitinase n=1 Tax=Cohnella terricola TaxID=1289167 RepID=A0A559J7S8_9BACL|nr:glycosyl hydrolase family 18 protein [Cohnella terricola]TVX95945.1 glycoside hydrolase [Cohnella terricola]
MPNGYLRAKLAKLTTWILSFVLVLSYCTPFFPASHASAAEIEAPQNLKVDSFTHNSVTLSWDLVDGITSVEGYNVWNAATGDWKAWVGAPPKEIGGLSPETEYSFYVTPGKENGKKSNVVTVMTAPDDPSQRPKPPLTPPLHLKITDVTENGITLGWIGSPGANGYDVSVNGQWKGGVWDGSDSYTFPIAETTVTGAVYTFTVAAQNLPDVSKDSNPVKLTWGQLEAPRDMKIVTATRTTASLGWAATPGATGYEIYRDGELIGTSDSNRYVATGLTEGQSYAFKAVAKNRLWRSPDSAEVIVVPGGHYNIVTYYTSWSVFDRGFMPEDIDVSQITHINYAFSDLCWRGYGSTGVACKNADIPLQARDVFDGEIVVGDQDVDLRNLAALRARKADNPNLNLIVSVGGWSWSGNFSNMAKTEETRRAFADSAVDFVREYRLDGLDIDWEYPVEGGVDTNSRSPEDKENFVLLMKTIREAFDAAGSVEGKYYLLTIASAQSDEFVVNADLARSADYLDFINIMTYDYSGTWEPLAHHNAPLYYDKNHPKATGPRWNVAGGVRGHLKGGVPAYKLVLGLPFYGKGWLNCPSPGQYQTCEGGTIPPGEKFGTWEDYAFDYTDVEDNYVNKNGYIRYWNEAAKVPYLYNNENKRFISYDDEESILYKASLVRSLDLAGVMSWDISGDRNKTLTTRLVRDLPTNGSLASGTLTAPRSLMLASIGSTAANIAWEASPGATGYDVFADNAWIGNTTNTEFSITNLNPSTAYRVQVLALIKEGGRTTAVSAAAVLDVTTTAPRPSSGGGGGGGGASTEPDTTGIGDPAANRLKAKVARDGNKATVTLQTADAVKSIRDSEAKKSQIVVVTDAEIVETIMAKEIIQAIAGKGTGGTLSLLVNGVELSVPAEAFKLGETVANVRITIQPPGEDIAAQFRAAAKARNAQIISGPLEFKIEVLDSANKSSQMEDFKSGEASRIFKLNADPKVDPDLATGAIYLRDRKTYRHVPTLFAAHSDGSVSAELKRSGSGIYGVVQSNPSFLDTNQTWAAQDIKQAAAKGIAFGDSPNVFGAKQDITRGELVSIIVNGLGIVPDSAKSPFKDVGDGTKYAEEIAVAWKLGLIKGKSADAFDPMGLITRQELATVLEQAMAFVGVANRTDPAALTPFKDRADIAPFAQGAMALMTERKILNGVSETKLAPLATVTKAQATVSVMRMLRTLNLTD